MSKSRWTVIDFTVRGSASVPTLSAAEGWISERLRGSVKPLRLGAKVYRQHLIGCAEALEMPSEPRNTGTLV